MSAPGKAKGAHNQRARQRYRAAPPHGGGAGGRGGVRPKEGTEGQRRGGAEAQFMHARAAGMASSRAGAMGCLHVSHSP